MPGATPSPHEQREDAGEKWGRAELRDAIGEPARQEDVGDAAILGPEVLNHTPERAPSAVDHEHD